MNRIAKLPLYWFGRLYVALHVGVIALIACFENESMLYRVVENSGEAGFWCVLVLALVSGIGISDVVVNDLMPKRYRLCGVKRQRHFVLMGLGIGTLSLAGVVAMEISWSVLLISLALPVAGASWLAVMDVYARGSEK